MRGFVNPASSKLGVAYVAVPRRFSRKVPTNFFFSTELGRMDLLGLIDADNVPIAVIHYTAPATVLLYFVSASSVPSSNDSNPNPALGNGDVAATMSSTATATRRRQSEPSTLLKWLFVLAILTFVLCQIEGVADV